MVGSVKLTSDLHATLGTTVSGARDLPRKALQTPPKWGEQL